MLKSFEEDSCWLWKLKKNWKIWLGRSRRRLESWNNEFWILILYHFDVSVLCKGCNSCFFVLNCMFISPKLIMDSVVYQNSFTETVFDNFVVLWITVLCTVTWFISRGFVFFVRIRNKTRDFLLEVWMRSGPSNWINLCKSHFIWSFLGVLEYIQWICCYVCKLRWVMKNVS